MKLKFRALQISLGYIDGQCRLKSLGMKMRMNIAS